MRIGHVIGGRFRIQGLAGSGGMGRVYRALDASTGNEVALKVLSLDASKYSRRFMREAKVMSELNHPNIVGYVDYGETDRGAPYIVMEWVSGEDLRQRMNRKKLQLQEALDIIANVGGALAFAHRRGVIHRDLKPSNLMMVEGDIRRIKLLDFGIARWRGEGAEKMTRTGISIGTPGYMAPEQSRGDKEIDGRADIYALGCVIYECLVGRRPFHGEDIVAVLARTALDEPPRVSDERSDIHGAFDDLLADMMASNVERRPRDGDVMAERARVIPSATRQVSPETEGITSAEKELLGILLLATAKDEPDPGSDPVVRDAIERAGGQNMVLENGTMVVTFRDEKGSATDMALRSVRCALALRKLCPTARLALATCQGDISGRRALTKTIQSAAELLRTAEGAPVPENRPLTIRLDETTCRLVDSRFDIRRRRKDTSGGFDLLGAKDGGSASEGSASECVGREAELGRITQLFAQTLSHRQPRSLLLTGEPGVGKSRLCAEAIKRIGNGRPELELWLARGDALGKGSAFSLLRQILHQAAGILHSDTLPTRRQKLMTRVGAYISGDDALRVAEFLGELCDIPFPADSDRVHLHAARANAVLMGDQMRRAWEEFLSATSAHKPVLIVLEDLHWGDLPTIRLMDGALRNVNVGSWMLLAVARPEIDQTFPKLWEERKLLRMQLKGLTESASRALIALLFGHKPDNETIARLVRLSSGNAFYLEELVYSLQQSKSGDIPGTVLALAQARLKTLGADPRRVLRAASVFGQSFWRDGVETLMGSKAESVELDSILSTLVESGLIERASASTTSSEHPGEHYRFHNELMREAAYSTLTDEDRDLGHRLAGNWLHENGIRDPLVLSNHFELGKQSEQATEWYLSASRHALEGNDLQAAIGHAQKGIANGAKGEMLGLLHAVIAQALLWTGENGKSSEHSFAAMDELEVDSDEWARAAGDGVTALGRCGAFADISALANSMLKAKSQQSLRGPALSALARSTSRLFLAGRYHEAVAILDHLPTSASDLDKLEPAVLGHICSARANKFLCDGVPGTYLRLSERSAAHFESCGDRRSAAITQVNIGFAYGQLGEYTIAEKVLRDVLNVALEMELGAIGSLARNNLGRVLLSLGELDEAWDMELIAIESFVIQGDDRMANGSRVYLSQIHQKKGALASAEKEVREALHGTSTVPTVRMQAYAQLASVLLEKGRPEQALECAQEAHRILQGLGQVEEGESLVLLMLVEAHLQCMQLDQAKSALERAYASVRRRADQIDQASWQIGFIKKVEENARIVQLAAEWGLGA